MPRKTKTKHTPKVEFRCLTEEQFDTEFGYVPTKDGGFYHDLDSTEVNAAHAERRLWTAVDSDDGDGTVIDAGWRVVNRFAYVISQRPYTEEQFKAGIQCFIPNVDEED